jgi:hypothetical protein
MSYDKHLQRPLRLSTKPLATRNVCVDQGWAFKQNSTLNSQYNGTRRSCSWLQSPDTPSVWYNDVDDDALQSCNDQCIAQVKMTQRYVQYCWHTCFSRQCRWCDSFESNDKRVWIIVAQQFNISTRKTKVCCCYLLHLQHSLGHDYGWLGLAAVLLEELAQLSPTFQPSIFIFLLSINKNLQITNVAVTFR